MDEEIQNILLLFREVLNNDNVYFEPPPDYVMNYPAIKISLDNVKKTNADNEYYALRNRYSIVFISRDIDLNVIHSIMKLRFCWYDRTLVSDNLRNTFFTLYY